jgi:hypothetical protein
LDRYGVAVGIYGEWLRVSPAELEHAKSNPAWLLDLYDELGGAGYSQRQQGGRRSGTDKTWQALDYLLTKRGFPVEIIYGEEDFEPDTPMGDSQPTYLTPEQVRTAAAALAPLSGEDLLAGVEPTDLVDIYPNVWNQPGELESAVSYLDDAKTFFEEAAKAGDAVVCWVR